MNAQAVLALLGDLYQQVAQLQAENERLLAQLAQQQEPAEPAT